jgi:hypothetical protein
MGPELLQLGPHILFLLFFAVVIVHLRVTSPLHLGDVPLHVHCCSFSCLRLLLFACYCSFSRLLLLFLCLLILSFAIAPHCLLLIFFVLVVVFGYWEC